MVEAISMGAATKAAEIAAVGAAGVGGDLALFGWNYNKTAFRFDQTQRWGRYTSGRKMALEQFEMFRQDVEDLTGVATNKLKTYAPIMTMSIGYCVTVFVEGRSGLKFPGPPTFISGLYLQCLGIGFAFLTLSTWLVFHAALRAHVAAVQLRTRKVRVPVPTQRELDQARKLGSFWEEQQWYDILKLPFVVPNAVEDPTPDEDVVREGKKHSKKSKIKGDNSKPDPACEEKRSSLNQVPGMKNGVPYWVEDEFQDREDLPGSWKGGAVAEPFEHFELLRRAQKEWWSAEVYQRINMLYGMMHCLQAFAYWMIIHSMTDLGLIWVGITSCMGLNAAVWLIFRLDVLPDSGGCIPIEFSAPTVSGIAVMLSYTHSPTQTTQDVSRWVAGLCLLLHILQIFRLYAVAKPGNNQEEGSARESGGRIFNQSASCEVPSWLPASFQVVTYLIAPPHASKAAEEQEKRDNDQVAMGDASMKEKENIDMTPWYYTRSMLLVVLFGWFILLVGRIVEGAMGERMLVTTPGAPPWTRRGQWYGWEFGPITSKHYAHVTPQRGHYSWQEGWGPQGQQELWPSDLFGFAPEADMWWSEEGVPGAPFQDENTWLPLRVKTGSKAELHASKPGGIDHSSHVHSELSEVPSLDSSAGEGGRRLRGREEPASASVLRPVVPVAVQWPVSFEPELLACEPHSAGGSIAAFTSNGLGAIVPPAAAAGNSAGSAMKFVLEGFLQFGHARGMSWGNAGLMVVTSFGESVRCIANGGATNQWPCTSLHAPQLPLSNLPAAIIDHGADVPLQAAIAFPGGIITFYELTMDEGLNKAWQQSGEIVIPFFEFEVVGLTSTGSQILVLASNGVVHHLTWRDGKQVSEIKSESPSLGISRTWLSACALPDSQIVRLASTWRKTSSGVSALHPELLI